MLGPPLSLQERSIIDPCSGVVVAVELEENSAGRVHVVAATRYPGVLVQYEHRLRIALLQSLKAVHQAWEVDRESEHAVGVVAKAIEEEQGIKAVSPTLAGRLDGP